MEAVKGIYHPDKLDAETFEANFTIRLDELETLVKHLQKQGKRPLQHFLITGKRGMGKSTLLRRVYLEAVKAPLNEKLIAVRLGSEQYKLSRLYKLWETVIDHLAVQDESIRQKREQLTYEKNYEEHLVQLVVDFVNARDKTLLLLIDNFDQFIDKLTAKEQHVLREILIQYPIQIIGNTVFYNDHFFRYDKPFYDYFKPIHLKTLDKTEAEDFMRNLAKNEGLESFDDIFKTKKSKIDTLRILSGGVPRTLVILLSILTKESAGEAVDYLYEMLEHVTPLYQDRMKALSSQQQEIMHHLAIHWDRTAVKELAAETRIPSKSISAQLAQLEDAGYINKISTSKKNHLYEIDERFFNIWLLMSEASPYDAKRVVWLTRWLDMFYEREELETYATFCSHRLKAAKPANRFIMMQALAGSQKLSWKFKDQIVDETTRDLSNVIPETIDWAKAIQSQKTDEKNSLDREIKKAFESVDLKHASSLLEKLKELDESKALFGQALIYMKNKQYDLAEQYNLMAVEKGNTGAMVNLGYLSEGVKKDYAEAERYYLMAVERGNIRAMFNLGYLNDEIKKDYAEAEKYYLMAVEKGNADAMFNLGYLNEEIKKDYAEAERYYLMAVKKGDALALILLGNLNEEIKKDYAEAEKYYLMAIEKDDARAMILLGNLNEEIKKDYAEAEKYYLMAVEKDDARAMILLGNLNEEIKKDYAEAEKYYLMAAEKDEARAMLNLAYLNYEIKKDYAEAERYYLMAVEKGDANAANNLAVMFFQNNNVAKKSTALDLISKISSESDAVFLTTRIEVLLWNENINQAKKVLEELLETFATNTDALEQISTSLIAFIIFKQRQFIYKLFLAKNSSLKDRFKPVYYALMHEMKEEFPDEYLKMPEELTEPVNDILNTVKSERARLGII